MTTATVFVPTPITVETFDRAFATAAPGELHEVEPIHDPRTRTTMLRTTIDGRRYTLTLVHMPDRETRRFAGEFNGYGGGEQWACAWTMAGVVDGAGADATYCRPVELDVDDEDEAVRARESHWHVEGRRDAIEGRPMHAGRADAFPTYAEGYHGATEELRSEVRLSR